MATAATLLAVAACGTDAPTADSYTVRDSAGIEIVENRAPSWEPGEAWLVDAEPVLVLGTLDGPDETRFYRMGSPRFRSDGSLVVVDRGNHRISAFAPDGAHLWSQGREGEGPGEYLDPSGAVMLTGDSVLVHDFRTRRATVLDPEGAYVRDFTPEVPEGALVTFPVRRVAPGVLVATGGAVFNIPGFTEGRMVRQPEPYHLAGTDGAVLDTLPTLPGPEAWYVAQPYGERGRSSTTYGVPFGRESWLAVGPGLIVSGSTGAAAWEVRDAAGTLVRIVRRAGEPRPVTRADWDRAVEEELADREEPAARAEARDRYDAMPRPDTWPAFEGLLVDDRGHLWVRQYTPQWEDEVPLRWWVFDPEGILQGQVTTPVGVSVADIQGDRILGRTTDDLGVERVVVYRIVGREGQDRP